jgi:hypothetical protein
MHLLLKRFLIATLLLKHSEYFASISILLVTKSSLPQCHTVMCRKLQNERLRIPVSLRIVRSPQNIETVRQSFTRSPRRSDRRCSVALGISESNLRRILHKDLNFRGYKMVDVQQLSDRDISNRKHGSWAFNRNFVRRCHYPYDRWSTLHLSGCANKQNFRCWAEENQSTVDAWLFGVEWQTSKSHALISLKTQGNVCGIKWQSMLIHFVTIN